MTQDGVHLIAEAGTNHNGSLRTAMELIDAAVTAAAQSVKFQMIFPEGLYLPVEQQNGRMVESAVFRRRSQTALAPDDFRRLAAYCREQEIAFSASVFDQVGISLLDELDAPYIKIASCDLNNSPLLRAAARTGRRLIISTGMSTLEEIERAVRDVEQTGNQDMVLMHCVSAYPCPTAQMNMGFLDVLADRFGYPVGLSDHTEQSLAAAIAVAKGASWIEKHLTLDRAAEGFDHAYAMQPAMFIAYTNDVRTSQGACRRRIEKLAPAERDVITRARRGLYASRDLAIGEVLRESDILIVRPQGPLGPNDIEKVVNRPVQQPIRKYDALTESQFVPRREPALIG
jgi:sialic acid synthase SpsE